MAIVYTLLIHLTGVSWIQDKADDIKIGLRSLAILCGKYTIPICTATGLAFFGLMSYAGMLNNHGIPYFVGLAIAAALLLPRLLMTKLDQAKDCKNMFLGTTLVGQVILGGLVVDVVLRRVLEGIPL